MKRFSRWQCFFACLLIVFSSCKSVQADEAYSSNLCNQTHDCNVDTKFNASYLYWSVQEDQIGFAIENFDLSKTGSDTKLKTHHPKWDSGVRLEGEVSSNCFPIGCRFGWTHFNTRSNASAVGNQPGVPSVGVTAIPGFSNQGDSPFVSSESAASSLKFNLNEYFFDVQSFYHCCGSCLSFRPFVGVFVANINQKQDILYSGIAFKDIAGIDVSVSRKNIFFGVGPRLGIELNWKFCEKLSLITNTSFAYLVGTFNTKSEFITPPQISLAANSVNAKSHRARPMASCLIALEWKEQISPGLALSFSLGYEFQYWWQQWHSSSNILDAAISGEGRWGDLSMNGLTVSGGVSF